MLRYPYITFTFRSSHNHKRKNYCSLKTCFIVYVVMSEHSAQLHGMHTPLLNSKHPGLHMQKTSMYKKKRSSFHSMDFVSFSLNSRNAKRLKPIKKYQPAGDRSLKKRG
jgi:hypothetical protein